MKKLLSVMFCMGLVCLLGSGIVGCADKKTPAKPDDKSVKKDPDKGGSAKDFKLEIATDKTAEVKASENKELTVKITRGKDAAKEVNLKVEAAKGVTATTDAKTEKDSATLKIEVAKDTAAGDYKVTVTASARDSKDATAEVTVTVPKAAKVDPPKETKSVKLTPDKASVKIKQGASGDATFKLELAGGAKDAKVAQKGDVKGLKVTVDVKGGDVKVSVAAADDAKEGDATVTIEATAEGATASSAAITVTVEKKDKK